MSKGKFARLFAAAFVTAGLTVIPAWSALAVTNPADNPSPITVQGDDGNTYHDGEDTLPGYDDEECTYIPGAYFDFAANRVRYADGQSIHWTEWDRASGYREWLAAQNETTTPTNTATDDGATNTTTKTDTKSTDTEETTEVEAVPLVVATDVSTENVTVTFGGQTANNPGRVVGLTILASLFGAGFLLLGVNALRTRFQQGGTN